MRAKLSGFVVGAVFLAWSSTAMAVSYASGVSKVGDEVTFILNQNAYSVEAILDGGAQTLSLPTTAGAITFNMTGYTSYQIKVSSGGAAGWTQFSDDSLTQSKYYSPRGVTVDINPMRSTFGQIIVAEGLGGAVGAGGRTTTDGLYIMSADQGDITGQGDTAYAGGVDWVPGGSSSPWKISMNRNDPLGQDHTIYIADWSDSHSGIWTADLLNPTTAFNALLDNTGRDAAGIVLENYGAGPGTLHGSVPSGPWVEGTGASRVMYTVDEDVGLGNVWQYNIGTTTSGYSTAPTARVTDGPDIILNGLADVVRDDDGSWWIAQYRYTDADAAPSLSHWADNSSTPSWISGDSTFHLDLAYGSLDINGDGNLLVMGTRGGTMYVLDISDPNNPVLVDTIAHSGSYVRDVAFDAAGNIYAVSSSSETLRIYSPGGYYETIFGSDGTFSVTTSSPPPTVVCNPSVTVGTDGGSCSATVTADQIDNGSFDPEGGPLTFTLTPSSPYPLGTNAVTFTATATNGLSTSTNVLVIVLDIVPPMIFCPASLTVEAQNENGAVVPFVVTATDNCSLLSLDAMPPPGSLFPIGTTPVQATTIDGSSNTASCSFTVTVLGSQGVKSNVLAELIALRASTPMDDSFAQKLDYVILHLQNSLDPAYWIDQAHLTPDGGNIALNEEKLAANMLDVIMSSKQCPVDPAILQGFIDRIVSSDRLLAMISIQEAASAGLNPNKIAEDQEQVARGDEQAEAGRYANAIEHYRNAWRHAIQLHLQISQDGQGGTKVRFIGVNGKSYLMEVSEDLVHWVPLGTNKPDGQGNVTFMDAAAVGQAQRFYRAVEQ